MVMAIRRCPYCKAIIDGVAEYCSNCGTQLLFPEDESKEEEIPGDKIVEEEKEEETLEAKGEESEKEEPSPEKKEEEEKEEAEVAPPEEEPEKKEEIEVASPPPEVDIDIKHADEVRMREARELVKKKTEKLWASVGTGVGEKIAPLDTGVPVSAEETKEEVPETLEKESSEKQAEEIEVTPPPEREEIDLRNIRLRRTPDTEKREKEEVDRFVESVKAERGKEDEPQEEEIDLSAEVEEEVVEVTPIPQKEEIDLRSIRLRKTPDTEEREKVEIERFVESIKKERERVQEYPTPDEEIPLPKEIGEAETAEIKEKIPPWAEKIKEEPPKELEDKEEKKEIEEPAEDLQEEEKKTPKEEPLPPTQEVPPEEDKPPPSPEEPPSPDEPAPKEEKPPAPTKEPLPKEEIPPPPTEELPLPAAKPPTSAKMIGIPEEVDQKVPFTREIKRAKRRRRSRLYAWVKSRAFDFVFIGVFCLICLGLASRLMRVSLFSLISATGPPILVFYFVLLLFYFGFFILFLGETPGDRFFPRD
jgi:hypothetical protein